MKKLIIVILMLLVVLCGGFIIFYIYDSRGVKQENNNKVDNNTTIESSNENLPQDYENDSETFKVRKVERENFDSFYKTVEVPAEAKNCVKVEKEGNNLIISLIESDTNEFLLESENKVTYNTKYTVSNVSSNDVKNIFYGAEGQDTGYPLVLLLLNDGTVKGIDIQNGYQTGNFIAKNISGIENIVKFEQVDVTPPNDSGFIGVVAISEDNSIYIIQHI